MYKKAEIAEAARVHLGNLASPQLFERITHTSTEAANLTNRDISDSPITEAEFLSALTSCRDGKATAVDNPPTELYQLGMIEGVKINNFGTNFLKLIKTIYLNNKIPDQWNKNIVVAVYKKSRRLI